MLAAFCHASDAAEFTASYILNSNHTYERSSMSRSACSVGRNSATTVLSPAPQLSSTVVGASTQKQRPDAAAPRFVSLQMHIERPVLAVCGVLSNCMLCAAVMLLLLQVSSYSHNETLCSHLLARGCTSRWVWLFCWFYQSYRRVWDSADRGLWVRRGGGGDCHMLARGCTSRWVKQHKLWSVCFCKIDVYGATQAGGCGCAGVGRGVWEGGRGWGAVFSVACGCGSR
jgi:hypothetical protein